MQQCATSSLAPATALQQRSRRPRGYGDLTKAKTLYRYLEASTEGAASRASLGPVAAPPGHRLAALARLLLAQRPVDDLPEDLDISTSRARRSNRAQRAWRGGWQRTLLCWRVPRLMPPGTSARGTQHSAFSCHQRLWQLSSTRRVWRKGLSRAQGCRVLGKG